MRSLNIALALAALAGTPAFAGDHAIFGGGGGGSVKLSDFQKFVVIYQENHSFDNLYGLWGNVGGQAVNDMRFAYHYADPRLPAPWQQIRSAADGATPYMCLPQNDVNLTSPPLASICFDPARGAGSPIRSAFFNKPFRIDDYIPASAKTCPNGVVNGTGSAGGCTRDIVHRFYSEQYQINGGQQNRYVTGSDAMGLAMGYYDTRLLPIYNYLHKAGAPNYVMEDNFFQSAFGGSFLNHQWLIAAATPVFAGADNSGGKNDLHSVVDANGMATNTPLYVSPLGSAVVDQRLTASCNPPSSRPATPTGVACGDFAVNTTQPTYQPYQPKTGAALLLPPLTNLTIGDRLTAAGVDWAWYSGGWSNADGRIGAPGWTNPTTSCDPSTTFAGAVFPNCPDTYFQFHHQAFNYYANYAPGTDARKAHLLDEVEFIAAAKAGTLKPVSFVKPLGADNEHPGYASESRGSQHLVDLIDAIVSGPDAQNTLIIVTYDEFGGQWDHVPPPPHNADTTAPSDQWGPGTRIPAMVISPRFKSSGVDSLAHDTTSILKLLEERFNVAPLGSRDAAVRSLSTALNVVN
jgi:acid phosphatase